MLEDSVCLKVLVVDDEQVIADSLALILNASGFEAFAAYSGETAVEMAMTLKPDALISDVVMGGMDGIEAAILISDNLPHCRVILFSGNATSPGYATSLLEKAEAQGRRFELLAKPVHPNVLLARLSAFTG